MFFEAYVKEALTLFESYQLQQPLAIFLKDYFRSHKKFGSRDRRIISDLLHAMYRIGPVPQLEPVTRLGAGALLVAKLPSAFFEKCFEHLLPAIELDFDEKLSFLFPGISPSSLVPFELSDGLDPLHYYRSLFGQSRVFIRLRFHFEYNIQKLKNAGIRFELMDHDILSFEPGIKLQEYLEETDYVVQDLASVSTGRLLNCKPGDRVWDCCAASGGKTIQLLDQCRVASLLATDIRSSILDEHRKRLQLTHPSVHIEYKVMDLGNTITGLSGNRKFDCIIADVPCSGSGTWRRAPENFYFFNSAKLEMYTTRQKAILNNILPFLDDGGVLYYITCSVFKAENEGIVDELTPGRIGNKGVCDKLYEGGDAMYIAKITEQE